MWATLDLLATILKYCSILTLVRLASTAFGREFGVSRQYLRLLELLFQLGQERIEKVESRHKLNFGPSLNGSDRPSERTNSAATDGSCGDGGAGANQHEKLTVDLPNGRREPDKDNNERSRPTLTMLATTRPMRNGAPPAPKTRRISTPDGPPVFLLDDYDDRDEDDNAAAATTDSPDSAEAQNGGQPVRQHEFHLMDACKLCVRGVSAIIDDQVTKRFTPEELKTWNLLTRTNAKNYQLMSRSLGLFWLFGFLVRYLLLMPLRIMFTLAGFLWLTCSMSLVGWLVPESLRARPYRLMSQMSFRMLSCGLTSRLAFHNRQYRAAQGDICVANHTSPLDVVVLACDNCYALVGQRHGGLIGLLEHALSRATKHVWFDRGEMRDRQLVTERLKQHLATKSNLPVLIFPEGTCINNSAVMMFRKGSFETTDRVCPVAIKYDPRFGDPFWNSAKHSYVQYLLLMMSSWAIKCDVWYLPPMERLPGESSAEFAGRVKAEIARQGGLDDLAWDGQLKRTAPKVLWKYQQQEDFVKRLKLD